MFELHILGEVLLHECINISYFLLKGKIWCNTNCRKTCLLYTKICTLCANIPFIQMQQAKNNSVEVVVTRCYSEPAELHHLQWLMKMTKPKERSRVLNSSLVEHWLTAQM